jgi:hypothetical protein
MSQNKLAGIIYPLFLYFAVCQIMNLLLQLLPASVGVDAVMRQGISSLVGFVALYLLCREKTAQGEDTPVFRRPLSGKLLFGFFAAILMLGFGSLAMNNILSYVQLAAYSGSYQTVQETFYSSSLLWEVIALGIITPIAEEYLYRWIIYRRLRSWLGCTRGILVCALVFGIIHLNLVQFVYASVLGLLLCILTEYYQDVRPAMLGHMTANILSLLRGETSFLSWLTPEHINFLPVTLLLFALSLIIAGIYIRGFKNN